MSNHTSIQKILSTYKQAIRNLPLLKYSWVLIATACILAFISYLQLKNTDVFLFAFGVLIISVLGFLMSYLLKPKDKFVKALLNFLLTAAVITLCVGVLSFGWFIIFESPKFYSRWFPSEVLNTNASSKKETTNTADSSSKIFEPKDTIRPNINVQQNHSGSGDNVAGDKIIKKN